MLLLVKVLFLFVLVGGGGGGGGGGCFCLFVCFAICFLVNSFPTDHCLIAVILLS